jgi:hypothetical protein
VVHPVSHASPSLLHSFLAGGVYGLKIRLGQLNGLDMNGVFPSLDAMGGNCTVLI